MFSRILSLPTVGARYTQSATSLSGSPATLVWTNTVFQIGDGIMNNGVYTVGPSGLYIITARARVASTFSVNNTVNLVLQKNSVDTTLHLHRVSNVVSDAVVWIMDAYQLSSGDTINITLSSGGASPSLTNNASDCYFALARI